MTISNCIRSGINKLCAACSPARWSVFKRGTLPAVSQRALRVNTDMACQLFLPSTLAARAAPLPQPAAAPGRPCTSAPPLPALRAGHTPLPYPHSRGARRNVLTQFNSHMLNTHLTNAYPPAVLGGPARTGFVDVLACHQTPQFSSWCVAPGGPAGRA